MYAYKICKKYNVYKIYHMRKLFKEKEREKNFQIIKLLNK